MEPRDRNRENEIRENEKKADRKHDSNPDPITGEPGAHPVGVAGGGTAGAVTGAAVGAAVGGPVGAVVGGAVGAVAGGYAGKGVGEMVNPTEEENYWRNEYRNRPYYKEDRGFDYYEPAYRTGWEAAANPEHRDREFEDVEPTLEKSWSQSRGSSTASWQDVREPARDSYKRIRESERQRNKEVLGMDKASDSGAPWPK